MTQKVPPIHARMARDHLRLSRECLERAYELDPTLRKATMPRQSVATSRRHAFDEGDGPSMSELRDAHGKLSEACDSLGELFGKDTFPFAQAREHCKAAADSAGAIHELLGGGESEDEELDEAKREKAAEEARDGVGETPATSVSTLKGGGADPDHRKDFNSIAQGKDAAMGLDVDSLLQRNPDDPRARGEAFSARFNNRGNSKQRARSGKPAPQHARDADANYESLDVAGLFQKNR